MNVFVKTNAAEGKLFKLKREICINIKYKIRPTPARRNIFPETIVAVIPQVIVGKISFPGR